MAIISTWELPSFSCLKFIIFFLIFFSIADRVHWSICLAEFSVDLMFLFPFWFNELLSEVYQKQEGDDWEHTECISGIQSVNKGLKR